MYTLLFIISVVLCQPCIVYLDDYNPGMDTDTDSSTAIQNAIDDAVRKQATLVFPSGGRKFRVDKQIIVSLDRDSPYFKLEGNNAVLYPNMSDYCLFIEPLCPFSQVGTGREVAHFEIKDLTFDGFFNRDSRAIQIGKNGFAISDFKHSVVENVLMLNFPTHHPVLLEGSLTRNVNFYNVVSRTNGFEIISSQPKGFVGDITFDGCEASASKTRKSFSVGGHGAMVRGIRVVNSIFYGGVELESGSKGQVADFWFTNMAIDRPKTDAIVVRGTGGQFNQLFFENTYIVGSEYSAFIVDLNPESMELSRQIVFRGGNLSGIKAESVMKIKGGMQVLIDGVSFSDIEANEAISLENTFKSTITNCNCVSVTEKIPNHLISIQKDCDNLVITSNQGDTLNSLIAVESDEQKTGERDLVIESNRGITVQPHIQATSNATRKLFLNLYFYVFLSLVVALVF